MAGLVGLMFTTLGVLGWRRVLRRAPREGRMALPAPRVVGLGLLALWALLQPTPALAQATQVVEYYHLDALGSVRVVTDQNGQVVTRHDFLPFGDEWNPPPSATQKKLFTGHERDVETGLDYFGPPSPTSRLRSWCRLRRPSARFYQPQIGRFTTIDPDDASATIDDPQSWNAYAYVRNNPLRNVDPDGRRWFANNGNAVWVEPNRDGSYTSPRAEWVELDPSIYNNGDNIGYNVAFVDGNLSFIGEDKAGNKYRVDWVAEEKGYGDETRYWVSTFMNVGSLAKAGGLAALRAAARVEVKEAVRGIKRALLEYWRRQQQAGRTGYSSGDEDVQGFERLVSAVA